MQTFLPYADFQASSAVLDDRRLGKQRVETFQILRALTWPDYAWKNHPAVRMWRGFVPALVRYGVTTCEEWTRRGHADTVRASLLAFTGGAPAPSYVDLHSNISVRSSSKSGPNQICPFRAPGSSGSVRMGTGTSRTLGRPFLAMTISSPAAARSTRSDSFAFASATLTCVMQRWSRRLTQHGQDAFGTSISAGAARTRSPSSHGLLPIE
jgi:hypothetical protein